MKFDRDLESIQEVRELVRACQKAQQAYSRFSQEQVDHICGAMARAGRAQAETLARLAVEETGFGKAADKALKNIVATEHVYAFIQNMKTAGVIQRDHEKRVIEIAEPMGIVAAIVPSTNPTSTTLYKILISLKARNGIILSPHPSARSCTWETTKVMREAAEAAGAPPGLIGCLSMPTRSATDELMTNALVSVILATGGTGLVKAAYSSGKPAFGVGPGNVPVFIERTADIRKAIADILVSKTFDNGTVCASEQAIVADAAVYQRVVDELGRKGAHFLTPEQEKIVGCELVRPDGSINPKLVGQSAWTIAQYCALTLPPETSVLVAQPDGVGPDYPLSREKLSPVLALYKEDGWRKACERCLELIRFGGLGHTMGIHSRDDEIIMEFALHKPVFRIIANSPTTHGAVGFSTGLPPALTLGCGTWGGNATSDNVSPLHLINRKRLAYGLRDVQSGPVAEPDRSSDTSITHSPPPIALQPPEKPEQSDTGPSSIPTLSDNELRDIVTKILGKMS
ncbi:acetaldehyde dehydrogenase (acetylating) [bacterium]|nr:acetaldehyde dehydrogenase (acetylating) [bacterium]